jgi:hypothetical protein
MGLAILAGWSSSDECSSGGPRDEFGSKALERLLGRPGPRSMAPKRSPLPNC